MKLFMLEKEKNGKFHVMVVSAESEKEAVSFMNGGPDKVLDLSDVRTSGVAVNKYGEANSVIKKLK